MHAVLTAPLASPPDQRARAMGQDAGDGRFAGAALAGLAVAASREGALNK